MAEVNEVKVIGLNCSLTPLVSQLSFKIADITPFICQLSVTGSKKNRVKGLDQLVQIYPCSRNNKGQEHSLCGMAVESFMKRTSVICKKRKVLLFQPLLLEGVKDYIHLATN